ncbi:uncharacterized protein LY79DRAFT_85628 [Colletotrichum navitas]|uniref:NADH:flavin oxidoreductase/NADH oxidase N-terminal domain-containing protein n=1 Tax=Colletotrichum navitas TaxID=681940 RepID=A0AAD8PL87_9PEZI|nr:uncharacterized protein LY79DRAFT_85628 [Colletotrichum navitas]KAK1569482.1 hypothetical protein LY79DRAFT_85628 [Colletotrichum navitas]
MSLDDMERTIADFFTVARTAIEIGFDGVEINSGNSNLLDQFLHSNINKRTDAYGGSPEKRARFPLDLLSVVASAIGPSNVGIRLEPTGIDNHTRGTERIETWAYLCSQIARNYVGKDRLSYVHFIEPRFDRIDSEAEKDGFYLNWSSPEVSSLHFRQILEGTPVFSCGGWGSVNFKQVLERGWDAIAFATWFVSSLDLPARLMNGAPLHAYDRSRFYGS